MEQAPKPAWHCNKCNADFDELQICWGTVGTQKVDVLDWFCPTCGNENVTFNGTSAEQDAWWDKKW